MDGKDLARQRIPATYTPASREFATAPKQTVQSEAYATELRDVRGFSYLVRGLSFCHAWLDLVLVYRH